MSEPTTAGTPEHPVDSGFTFQSLEDFVSGYIAPVIQRRINRSTAMWCPSWWMHPEAVARFSVLWRAFEYLKLDAAIGLSTWWIHHADPHIRALMHPDLGPFVLCDAREGHSDRNLPPLPVELAPPGFWSNPVFTVQPPEPDDGENTDAENRDADETDAENGGEEGHGSSESAVRG
ncbi:DUF4913 domain-containing protein [Streptomycetaceae bacterium NBC_01309]